MSTRTDSDRLRMRNTLLANQDLGLDAATSTAISHVLLPVLKQLQAEAWNEGYRARKGEGWQSPGEDNPYEQHVEPRVRLCLLCSRPTYPAEFCPASHDGEHRPVLDES